MPIVPCGNSFSAVAAAQSLRIAPVSTSFLGSAFGKEALCTMRLARALFPEAPNHQNQTLRAFLGIDDAVAGTLCAHRALDDAIVTAHILIACRHRFRDRFAGEPWERFARRHGLVTLGVGRLA